MAQLVVRSIEAGVKTRLQRRARRHGRSMEEEVRDILRNAAREPEMQGGGLGTDIASLFADVGLDDEIVEFHGHHIDPVSFRK